MAAVPPHHGGPAGPERHRPPHRGTALGRTRNLPFGDQSFDAAMAFATIDHWQDPAQAQVAELGVLSVGFPEVIAVRGDTVYRMSDLGGAPSLIAKYHCKFPPAP